tara:strand:+ start:714 stop:1067 length:354 start_codon:yes stop_codon:yes gene_type:complete
MRKRMKSKGYAKGGAKMMKAMRGKMAKGYAKGGAKKVMKAMGGRMMAKGYAKGGAKKVMKASRGTASFMKSSGKQGQKAKNVADVTIATFTKTLKGMGVGNRITANDINKAKRQLLK